MEEGPEAEAENYELHASSPDNPDPEAETAFFNPMLGIEPPEHPRYERGGSVVLRNVSAGTEEAGELLKEISPDIRPGEMFGITGDTAEARILLAGLIRGSSYAPEGAVEIDGINVRDYRTEALAERIGLLSGAQAAAPDADRERELQKDPEILLLVETETAPDEVKRMAAHYILTKGRDLTTIWFSGDPVSLRRADRIAVLEDGRLAGCGTHDELLSSCPSYADAVGGGEEEPEDDDYEILEYMDPDSGEQQETETES